MSDLSNDLIAFPEIKNSSLNVEKNSVLQEFDPLFHLTVDDAESCGFIRSSPKVPDSPNKTFRTNQINEWSSSSINNRLGGIFDKDEVWDGLREMASSHKEVFADSIRPVNTSPNISSLSTKPVDKAKFEVFI